MNAGHIEFTKGNFMFYCEGMATSVGKVREKMDDERIKIGRNLEALDLSGMSIEEILDYI